MNGYIHSIESFGTVDGPGIRFVVFLQGCPMRCMYCHNPDTWDTSIGKKVTADEILNQYEQYRNFLKNGGITVTGGEPLLQMDFVIELFQKAKERNIHTCLDTSGITFSPNRTDEFDKLMAVTDLVLLDIKHIDNNKHIKLTGHSNANILLFAKYLDKINKPVWIRHVVVPNITMNDKYLEQLGEFIGSLHNVKALDVLPYHDMGKVKYKALGIDYPLKDTPVLSSKEALHAKEIILSGARKTHNNFRQ
jgi:pyruvate formate lyase activating enzyme